MSTLKTALDEERDEVDPENSIPVPAGVLNSPALVVAASHVTRACNVLESFSDTEYLSIAGYLRECLGRMQRADAKRARS